MTRRPFIAAATLAIVLAGCGGNDDASTDSSNTTRTTEVTAAIVSRTIEPFGAVLTDAEGRTLYVFDKDQPVKPKSTCNGQCATNWPPVLTSEGSGVGEGLDASKLGETVRDEGTRQVTYNDWPLYRFVGDQAPGDTNGQGVGGTWHIAGADGNAVLTAATTTTRPPATTTPSTINYYP